MKYKVLYRKYRPDSFESIIGQDYIIKTLKNSIINNKISHAYIFSGPRGTGKTTTAKVFSKAINCLNPVDGSPCGECEFCKNFNENPDIIEIDAASNNGVDEIRTLIDNIKLTPSNGKYKVYIIDEVHMLTVSAFNALLLTLEEPPAHAIFILATTNIENVPITILSRCQRYDFQKIKVSDIVKRLKEVCEAEKIECEEEALNEIANLAEGGMRDALSLLDQLAKNGDKVTLELVEKQIKTISQSTINTLLDYIEDNNVEKCLDLIADFKIRAIDYKVLLKKLMESASVRAKNIKSNGKQKRLSFIDYKKLVFDLADSISKVNINVDSYTILEMILLDYFTTDNVTLEKEKVPKEIKETVIKEDAQEDVTLEQPNEIIQLRINNCFANAKKEYLENMKKVINDYLLKTSASKIKTILEDSILVAASDRNLIFTCKNEHNVDNFNKSWDGIEKILNKETNGNLKIVFISSSKWNNEKELYIKNLKNNIKYEYIEEKEEDTPIVSDVFDISKVEIV